MANPTLISIGAGTLRTADPGSAEPTDLLTAWPAAWGLVGYTFTGSTFGNSYTVEAVEVAEELDAISYDVVSRAGTFKFVAAEITATRMRHWLNGGTLTVNGAGDVLLDPPAVTALGGTNGRRMYGWESRAGDIRLICRQCWNGGAGEVNAGKGGSNKTGYPFELMLEKPSGVEPFRWIFSAARA